MDAKTAKKIGKVAEWGFEKVWLPIVYVLGLMALGSCFINLGSLAP